MPSSSQNAPRHVAAAIGGVIVSPSSSSCCVIFRHSVATRSAPNRAQYPATGSPASDRSFSTSASVSSASDAWIDTVASPEAIACFATGYSAPNASPRDV